MIRAVLPEANVPTSIRESGIPVLHSPASERDAIIEAWLAEHAEGTAVVIGDPSYVDSARVRSLTPAAGEGPRVRPRRARRPGPLRRGRHRRGGPLRRDDEGDPAAGRADVRSRSRARIHDVRGARCSSRAGDRRLRRTGSRRATRPPAHRSRRSTVLLATPHGGDAGPSVPSRARAARRRVVEPLDRRRSPRALAPADGSRSATRRPGAATGSTAPTTARWPASRARRVHASSAAIAQPVAEDGDDLALARRVHRVMIPGSHAAR